MTPTIRKPNTARGYRAGQSAIVAGLALAFSLSSWAIDFGRITVNSQQGQPLNADVVLTDVPVATPDNIRLIASTADAADITAVARARADGALYIHVESRAPINTQSLALEFEISYPTADVGKGIALMATVNRTLTVAIPAAAMPVQTPVANGPVNIAVTNGDTASEIVYEALTDARANGATMNQMLVALQNQNPKAFIESNVNLIKAGQTIQLPSTQDVLSVDVAKANVTIAAQNAAFKARKQRLADQAAQAKATQDPTKGSVQAAEPAPANKGDRLELAAAGSSNDQVEALANQAADAERIAAEKETAERVQALEALATKTEETKSDGASNSNSSDATSSLGVSAPALPPTAEQPTPAVKESLLDRARAHPFWSHPQVQNPFFKPFIFLIVLMVMWVFWPRRFTPETTTDLDPRLYSADVTEALNHSRAAAAAQTTANAPPPDDADLPAGGDPLTRAHALWNEGEYELAIHTINAGIAQRPDRADYYMALLNFHLQQGAHLAFEATARDLQTIVDEDSAEWAQCCDWGQRLDPGNPIYGPIPQRDIKEVTALKASDLDL